MGGGKIHRKAKTHMRNFTEGLNTFTKSINGYDYYTDFAKVYENVAELKVELNILNSLIRSTDIEGDFRALLAKYPECLRAILLLIAVREREIFCQDEHGATTYRFDKMTQTVDEYCYFMRKTGLFDLLEKHIISNLYDYATGVKVGLGSKGRKNRGIRMDN